MISILEFEFDEIIVNTKLIYRKYDKELLVDNDLSYSFQFLTLKSEVYTELVTKDYGSISIKVKTDLRGIQ